ncbi:MAG: type IV toxin-antitoxin system AbiEi family antitoxin [Pseudonocardiaceae bacterium]
MELDPPALHLRPRLRGAGYSDQEIRRMLRTGDLTAVRPGAYVVGTPPDDAAARHVLRVRADLEHLTDDAVASHASAAVLHGLPTWGVSLERVHVSRNRRSGGRVGRRVHVHVAPLKTDEVVTVDGITVTSPARTVVDLARSVPVEQAVVVADAALARGLVDRAELDDAVQRATRWRGSPAAQRVVAFADGRSESVGESRSRVALRRAGLPDPVPQWEVRTADGLLVGRVDFGWPGLATVGEFDGRVKYGRLLRPGQQPGDAVYAEKLREDELRSMGLSVVRWTWPDLARFTPVVTRLQQSFQTP